MPKVTKQLTALEVSRITEQGKHNVGSGLYLEIRGGSRSWVLNTMVGGKRRHIGMGAYPKFSLAQAREKASKARELIEQGIDPIEHKKAVRSAIKAEQAKGVTFRQCAVAYMDAHSHAWGSIKHAKQWGNTLSTYAYPAIGSMLVKDVTQAHILAILRPIWQEKTDTAKRVRNRIELVLDYAIASGYREDSNPARWKGKLDKLLPVPAKIAKVRHHKAVPVDEMPAFIEQLSMNESMAARCLLFCILTACRSGEARGAVWSEIDMDARVWTIPAERMKAGKDHQVPLSDQAMELLCSLPRVMGDGRVFPPAKGKMLSDATLSILMRKMGRVEVPHGFRSTFRDWAGDRTNYPRDLAEAALAHTLPNQVEAAYRRGTALEKRRSMMNDWAGYIFSGRQADSSVIQFKKGVA